MDQGAFNETRVHEAQAVTAFAAQAADTLHTDRIFLLGDFNAYTHEDPAEVLYAAGYTDLGSTFDPSEQTYSYNGLEGSLDHVFASPAAKALVTGADVWQINAQEAVAYAYSRYNYNATLLFNGTDPFAASDHDPVIVGLNLPSTPVFDPKEGLQRGRRRQLQRLDVARAVVVAAPPAGYALRRLGRDRRDLGRHRGLDLDPRLRGR